jgi:type IV secretory pathway TrbD component
MTGAAAGVGIVIALIYLIIFVIWIYGFILFVKLAKRGIKALDIYINEKTKKQSNDYYISGNNNENP